MPRLAGISFIWGDVMKASFRKKFRPSWPQLEPWPGAWPPGAKPPWRDEFSDGCTFVRDYPETKHCCLEHDQAYYEAKGGWRGRMRADRRYRECMLEVAYELRFGNRRRRIVRRAWRRWLGVRLLGWIAWYT